MTVIKVVPADAAEATTKFPKPIYGTTVTEYPSDYLAAKKRVGEFFFTLPDGRNICYFKDGDSNDVPMICLHGGGEGKYMWLQKEPLPGIFQIAIDRMGYGKSDLYVPARDYTFKEVADDIAALADHLGFDQFVLCGFSIGTSWCMQIACQLLERVRGIVLFGTMADTGHPKMSKATVKQVGKPPAILDPVNGCLGCILRSAFVSFIKSNKKFNFKECFQRESSLPKCKIGWGKFEKDPFWVCSKVDSFLAYNRADALLGDAYRSLCRPWMFDISEIKCPVFIYQGDGDYDMGSSAPAAPNFIKEMIPHAELEFVEGTGHVCVVGPQEHTRNQIIKSVQAMPRLFEPYGKIAPSVTAAAVVVAAPAAAAAAAVA